MATTKEKIAAHIDAGFDPARKTPLSVSEWIALNVWFKKNPELRFRRGDEITPGQHFYVYHRKCRAGIYTCPPEKIEAYRTGQKESARSTPEERAVRKRARKIQATMNILQYKAAERSMVVSLGLEDLDDFIDAPCFFCGVHPPEGRAHGIDRLFNGHGYHYDNTVPCCWPCNHAKMSLEANEFLDLVARIARHQLKLQAQ